MRNRFSDKNSGVISSSLRAPSQLSCIVLISRARRDFCSFGSLETHFSLSNLDIGWAEGFDVELEDEVVADGVKNEVMERAFLGTAAAGSVALRLGWPDIVILFLKYVVVAGGEGRIGDWRAELGSCDYR